MTLHVNRSTVGHDAPLAPLPQDAESGPTGRAPGRRQGAVGDDRVAVSGEGRRLAAMAPDDLAQVQAIDQADALVRDLLARAAASPQALVAAQGAPDPERVARLLAA